MRTYGGGGHKIKGPFRHITMNTTQRTHILSLPIEMARHSIVPRLGTFERLTLRSTCKRLRSWISRYRPPRITKRQIQCAYRRLIDNHLHNVQRIETTFTWMRTMHRMPLPNGGVLLHACRYGASYDVINYVLLHTTRFLRTTRRPFLAKYGRSNYNDHRYILYEATRNGHLHIVKRFISILSSNIHVRRHFVALAIQRGHIDLLHWLPEI